MAWQGIEGHDDIVERFRRALTRGRLASTFLFVGPPGVGKRTFAEKLAQALLCSRVKESELAPCGTCDACVQVASHTHPDLYIIEKPSDKSTIPLQAFVGDEAHRMREGLCHDIALKPFMGGRKVAIIDDADALNEESANCLLKTLEEPPPRSVLILIGTSPDKQLPTIRSRAQIIRFRPLETRVVADLLKSCAVASDDAQRERLAGFSAGSLENALALADEDLWAFRQQLLRELAKPQLESVSLARELSAFVDAAGKEATARRARSRQVIGFAVDFYRQLMRARAGLPAAGDAEMVLIVEQAATARPGDTETAMLCAERSLAALGHIDRNANQATMLEAWCDDLARIVETGQPAAISID